VEHVVGVAAAEAGDRALVTQDRVHATVVIGLTQVGLRLGRQRLGAELRERAVVAGGEHPPAGLALRAELLDQDRGALREPQADHRALRLRRLRLGLDVDAAPLREMDEQAAAVVEAEHDVFAEARDAGHGRAAKLVGPRRVGLQGGELQRVGALERRAGDDLVEPLGERADLRQLGHVGQPVRDRAASRTIAAHSSIRSACVRWLTMHTRIQ
jgi:hypothetical protein